MLLTLLIYSLDMYSFYEAQVKLAGWDFFGTKCILVSGPGELSIKEKCRIY